MKKIVIISTSLRNKSNSEKLAQEFMRGALDAGNDVSFVTLKDKKIGFCKGCMACQKVGHCIMKDDANQITDMISSSDIVVWATPVYYYSVSGQMKTMIDRANSLFVRENRFREVYLLLVAAEDEAYTKDGAVKAVQGWIDCYSDVSLKGVLFCGGVSEPKEIEGSEYLEKAYNLGKSIE